MMLRALRILCCGLTVAMTWAMGTAHADDPAPNDPKYFEAKVYPIFQERCISCHGPEKKKGELRLDLPECITKGGESGPAVVPGKIADSLIVAALKHETYAMPPSKRLPAAVVAELERGPVQREDARPCAAGR